MPELLHFDECSVFAGIIATEHHFSTLPHRAESPVIAWSAKDSSKRAAAPNYRFRIVAFHRVRFATTWCRTDLSAGCNLILLGSNIRRQLGGYLQFQSVRHHVSAA